MKKTFLLFIYLIASIVVHGQPCNVDLLAFNTQASIDNFSANHPGCTIISGQIEINGADITNLDGLSSITAINGNLGIFNNPLLASVSGLSGITEVDGEINIDGNPLLVSLNGLHNLLTLGTNLRVVNNLSMTSIQALDNLLVVPGFLSIGDNNALNNLSGLNHIRSVGGSISIGNNASLQNLDALNVLEDIGGYIYIANNPLLANLNGLINVKSVNDYINILNNNVLTSLSGLDNIDPVSINYIKLESSTNLSMCGVKSICNFLSNDGGNIIGGNAMGCSSKTEILASSECAVILPVELIGFKGKNTIEGNYLTWETTWETNNSGFAVERSLDAVKFEKIGYVVGNGTTTQTNNYSFTDALPELITYYRLKQIDLDNSVSFSRIISVKRDNKEFEPISVYPNPSNDQLFIVSKNKDHKFTLLNAWGMVVIEASSLPTKPLDISNLQNGLYMLRVGKETFKILVRH